MKYIFHIYYFFGKTFFQFYSKHFGVLKVVLKYKLSKNAHVYAPIQTFIHVHRRTFTNCARTFV